MTGTKDIHEVRSFHGPATFYRRFIKGFSIVMTPIMDCLEKDESVWSNIVAKAFMEIKKRMVGNPVMCLLDFSEICEVVCDTFGIGIGGVLAQEGHQVAYFRAKLAKQKYYTYDKEFYAVVQAPRCRRHYLLPQEFILFSDHEALKYIYSQKKLNARHGQWIELQNYTFTLRHKAGVKNKVTDALSSRVFI